MSIAEIIRALFPEIGGLVSPVFPRWLAPLNGKARDLLAFSSWGQDESELTRHWLASAFLPRHLPRILEGFRAALLRYCTEHAYLRGLPRWKPGERAPE
jgi:hypothetical protein